MPGRPAVRDEALDAVRKPYLHARGRAEHEIHPHQRIERVLGGHAPLLRGDEHVDRGLEGVGSMVVRPGQEKQVGSGEPGRHPRVHRAFRMLERERLGLIHVPDEQLGARPDVDEARAAVVDLLYEEEAPVGALEQGRDRAGILVETVRREEPELFDASFERDVNQMIAEAIDCETAFAEDLLGGGIAGMSVSEVRRYLEYIADQRLATLRLPRRYGSKNPFPFMDLQDVQELANFFERRVSAYQVGVTGEVALDAAF